MATKREKLTTSEQKQLTDFVGRCVIENVQFPSSTIGASNTTIQEILHNRSVESLGTYNDYLETQAGKVSRAERIIGAGKEKTFGNSKITYSEAISNIDLIIKQKLNQEFEERNRKRALELKKELESLETPNERKNKIKAELKALGV